MPLRARKTAAKSSLEAVLQLTSGQDQLYLAKAAARYLWDISTRETGGSVTMNWSALPRSRRQRLAGSDGFSQRSVNSGRVLRIVSDNLAEQEAAILRAILVEGLPVSTLERNFDLSRAAMLKAGLRALRRLAHVYDRFIAAEAG